MFYSLNKQFKSPASTSFILCQSEWSIKRQYFHAVNEWMDGWIDEWIDGWTDGRTDGRTAGRTDGRLNGRRSNAWTDERTERPTDRRTDKWTDEQTNERMNNTIYIPPVKPLRSSSGMYSPEIVHMLFVWRRQSGKNAENCCTFRGVTTCHILAQVISLVICAASRSLPYMAYTAKCVLW